MAGRGPGAVRKDAAPGATGVIQNLKATVLEVEGWNLVGSVGINNAVSKWGPGLSWVKGPMAVPAMTATGAPRLVVPSLN